MQLNIEGEEPYRLAAELARITGKPMSTVVTEALREKLDAAEGARAAEVERKIAASEAIGDEFVERLRAANVRIPAQLEMDDEMYDEFGLPR